MNRRHTRSGYLHMVERMRDARPDIAFSSDFIVGFPGETEDDFLATLTLVDAIGYAGAFSFKYSPRPGTPAAEMDDQVPEPVKRERLARLQAAIDRNQAAFNARWLGKKLDVLLEKPGRRAGQLVGRSPYLQPVHVMLPESRIGDIVPVNFPRPRNRKAIMEHADYASLRARLIDFLETRAHDRVPYVAPPVPRS